MTRIKEEDIQRVREKADIAEIIGRYLPLSKKGRNYAALCPFHSDHDPSMNINTEKQIFKCFVCGEGGNVFSFVQKYEKLSFPEAVLKVAEMAGIPLEYQQSDFISERYDEKTRGYFKLMQEAIDYLTYQLDSASAKPVKEYLYQRGYDDALIKEFQIGYDPEAEGLYRFLKAKGFTERDMLSVNLIRNTEDGFRDVFQNRITFPILNTDHQPVAFSARASKPGQEPKYINTGETEIYTKGNLLYHYSQAKQSIKEAGCVYIVEGVTDVFAFWRAGISNVCATLGTAMSKTQIQLLRNLRVPVVLCYDGDSAGQNANLKNAQLLSEAGISISVVHNNTDMDPDEVIKNKGMDYFKEMIHTQDLWIEYIMRILIKKYDLNNYNQKKEYAARIVSEIKRLPDEFDRKNFLLRLSSQTEFDINQLEELLGESTPPSSRPKRSATIRRPARMDGRTRAEYEILSQMLYSNDACTFFKESIGYLPSEAHNRLAMLLLDNYRKQPGLLPADLLDRIEEEALKQLVVTLIEQESFAHTYNPDALKDAFVRLQVSLIDEQINELKRKLKLLTDSTEKAEATARMLALKKERMELFNANS